MPRLRPLKTAEAIAAVPENEPVMIELSDDSPALEVEEKPDGVETKEPEKVETKAPEPVPVQEDEAEEPEVDEAAALREQLAKLTKAEKDARAALETERTRSQQDIQREQDQSRQYRDQAQQAQLDAVLNALDANKSEADKAQGDYEVAMANNDYKAASEAQRRGQRAEAQIVRLEEGKDALEARIKAAPKEEPQRTADPFEASIAKMPEQAKSWLRGHRDYMTDQRKNAKIQALHWDVVDEGHEPFSTGYFESLETHLGMRQAPATTEIKAPAAETKRAVVSAPVTREAPSLSTGKPQSTRVTLSPLQREAARISGITEQQYAKEVLKLEQAKKEGHYSESR